MTHDGMHLENRDRERDDDTERMEQALAVVQEVRKRHFNVWALDSRVWRTLQRDELAAYAKLDAAFDKYNSVPISLIASHSQKFIPSADKACTKPCVKQYVKGVSEIAEYVAMVDRTRQVVVEQELSAFLATLLPEQQEAVKPVYQRLVAIMTPANHMPRVRVDSGNVVPS
jgi:hypothetical protein